MTGSDDGWTTATNKKLSSAKPASDSKLEGPTSTYEAMRAPPRFGNTDRPQRPGALPGQARAGTPQNFPRGASGGFGGEKNSGGFGGFNKGSRSAGEGIVPMSRGIGRPGARADPMTPAVIDQKDYFAQECLEAAEMVPKGETKTVEVCDVAYMKTVAHLVHRFRSTVVIPEQILNLNLEMVRPRAGDRGDRSGRAGDPFARGVRQNVNEEGPSFGEGRGNSAMNNDQPSGGDPGASSFARGGKGYSQSSTQQSGKNYGGRGGRAPREEECDPDLVIERINLTEIVEDENVPTNAPADENEGDAAVTEAAAEEEAAMAAGFVRRQAKRKLNESGDEKVQRQLRGHLNKLTDKNYDGILAKTCGESGIATPAQLEFFIKLVYEKASQMEKFLATYAKLMVDIEEKMIEKKVIDGDAKAFKNVVLNAAQEMYKSVVTDEWEPAEDLDDEDKFNATVQRKKERKGLACFISILTTTKSISAKKATNGMIARKVNAMLMDDSFAHASNERNIEFIMSLFGAYMEDPDRNDPLIMKARSTMNDSIPKIQALCKEEDPSKKLSVRHQILMENLLDDWSAIYQHGY